MLDYLLPIGSVVTLEEGKHKLMIFGVKQTHSERLENFMIMPVFSTRKEMLVRSIRCYLITIRLKA